jgi:hypothetical protein
MYKSLETIPYKTFIKIYETDEVHYLSKEEKDLEDFTNEEIIRLNEVWIKIKRSYLEMTPNEDELRVLDINKEIDYLESKYKLINACCECLRFDWDVDLVKIIRNHDFILTDENYYQDIKIIELQSKSIMDNVEVFKTQLPKEKQNTKKITIDDMMASICAVLGIDFDFNTVSFTKVNSFLKQVDAKIKSLENK